MPESHELGCKQCKHAGEIDGLIGGNRRRFEHQKDYDAGYNEGWARRMRIQHA